MGLRWGPDARMASTEGQGRGFTAYRLPHRLIGELRFMICPLGEAAAPNQPPAVSIASPADGATFTVGDSIEFQGTANDAENSRLAAGSLVWTSSTAGEIGRGTSFSRNDLSIGAHEITLTATDADGATSSASRVIRIEPEL